MSDIEKDILDVMDQDAAQARKSWAAFVERDVADFLPAISSKK